jgi:glycosyltransferase involved in cell wall biosynthesis
MKRNFDGPRASIIIPAHNEAAVIARTLGILQRDAKPGEFEIVVVCNGCSDGTAERARQAAPTASVLESTVASKTHALNLGSRVALAFPRIYLDADLEVSPQSLRALIRPLEHGEALAAAGRMAVDLSASSNWVRAFYRVWRLNPYFDKGKFGGLFALSRDGHKRLDRFPKVTADDEYLHRLFSQEERAEVARCHFVARAPRRVADLVKIRQRGRRGTRELEKRGHRAERPTGLGSAGTILMRILRRPFLWPDLPVYLALSVWVRLKVRLTAPSPSIVWERDESSRLSVS